VFNKDSIFIITFVNVIERGRERETEREREREREREKEKERKREGGERESIGF